MWARLTFLGAGLNLDLTMLPSWGGYMDISGRNMGDKKGYWAELIAGREIAARMKLTSPDTAIT
jgi:hypothetical protein